MYEIPNPEMPAGFVEAWRKAGAHLQSAIGQEIKWLNPSPYNIMGSHLTFRLGNQVFFVFVEVDERPFAAMKSIFLRCAAKANAVACIMPMRKAGAHYVPAGAAAGLVDARTRALLNPSDRQTPEPVEMSDWELHDFAVQIVAGELEKEGKDLKNTQSHLEIDPSIWFVDREGPACVVVRAVRYPRRNAPRPESLRDMADAVRGRGARCFFASVGVAHFEQSWPENAHRVLPLLRGSPLVANYPGLEEPSSGGAA